MFTSLGKSRLTSLKKEGSCKKHLGKIRNYNRYKAKKNFESALNDEIKKVGEESEAQKRFKRDNSDDIKDEIIVMVNTPVKDN
jgi:hypothetical protein